jgi:hypothetical protein
MKREKKIAAKLMVGTVIVGSVLTLVDNIKDTKEIISSPEFKDYIKPYRECIVALKKDMA